MKITGTVFLTIGLLGIESALAADDVATSDVADSSTLSEVVVTAERRSERLTDVPMSIEALSQEQIDAQGLHTVDDLSRASPGVTFLRNGMGTTGNYNDEDSDISIRGIDSSAGASTTAVYIDDTPIQTRHLNFGTLNPFPALFDLDRVEVLKGPQGTLFGAGSEGGAVRFISPEASLTKYSGFVRSEVGSIENGGNNYEIGGAVGGPIIDGVLGFRLSASLREDGGWVDRVRYAAPPSTLVNNLYTAYSGSPTATGIVDSNANWHRTTTFRAALKWQATDKLTIDPSFYLQTLKINDTGAYWFNLSDPSSNRYFNGNAQANPSYDPFWIAAVKVNWDLGAVRLTSNTSYFSRSQHSTSDYSQWLPTVFAFDQYHYAVDGQTASAYFTDQQRNVVEDVHLSSTDDSARFTWTAGLYYAHVDENSTESIVSPDLPIFLGQATAPQPGFVGYRQPEFSMLDKQLALYGEVNAKLLPMFTLTLGLRYSDLQYTGNIQESGDLLSGANVHSSNSGEERPLTPRVVAKFQPTPDNLLYLSAAKGFRPGGVNAQLPPLCQQYVPAGTPSNFSSDSLWHYELGSKNTLFDRHLQVSASLYYLNWSNIQQFVYLTCGLGFDYNLGKVTGRGGDIDVQWRPTSNISAGITAGYTTAYYAGSVPLVGTALSLVTAGDHLPSSPWNVDANFEYRWKSWAWQPYGRADYQFTTAQNSLLPYQDPANAPNQDYTLPGLPSIRLLTLRAGVYFNGMDLSVFVQNALNYNTATFVSRDLATLPGNGYPVNFDTNYFGRGYAPRTIGATVSYRF